MKCIYVGYTVHRIQFCVSYTINLSYDTKIYELIIGVIISLWWRFIATPHSYVSIQLSCLFIPRDSSLSGFKGFSVSRSENSQAPWGQPQQATIFFFCFVFCLFVFFYLFIFIFIVLLFFIFLFVFCLFLFFVFVFLCFLFFVLCVCVCFCFVFFCFLFLFLFLFCFFFVCLFGFFLLFHQVPRLQRGPNPLSGILIPRPPGDNHNKKGELRTRGLT